MGPILYDWLFPMLLIIANILQYVFLNNWNFMQKQKYLLLFFFPVNSAF